MRRVRVIMLVSMAGEGFTWEPGAEVELPADEAKRLIAAGFAEPAPKTGKARSVG